MPIYGIAHLSTSWCAWRGPHKVSQAGRVVVFPVMGWEDGYDHEATQAYATALFDRKAHRVDQFSCSLGENLDRATEARGARKPPVAVSSSHPSISARAT